MSLISYLREVKAELIHISWPKRETIIQHTLLVIGISLTVGLALGALDGSLTKMISRIIGL